MKRLVARPAATVVAVALLFWIASWWPSLLPRGAVTQGLVSGLCAAIGWLIGAAVARFGGAFTRGREALAARIRHVVWWVAAALAVAGAVVALAVWRRWQNQQRAVMGMPDLGVLAGVPAVLVSIVVLGILVLIGRLIGRLVTAIDRQFAKLIAQRLARLATAAVVIVVVIVIGRAGGERFVSWADRSFGLVNDGTPDGVVAPTLPTASGSPDSPIAWDTLGLQGRRFAGGAPTAAEISEFSGAPALDPVRVYVGLDSVGDLDARVAAAVDELERTGAFERRVLVVATATGTGWINPDAASTIEYMYGGDTAIVSVQYSFFPSWVAFVIDPTVAVDAGAALFDAVHERWSALPAATRPELVVFGESLGSFGGEAPFEADTLQAAFADLAARADAALFVGPTTYNTLYTELVARRDAGTPSWRPGRADLPNVRVANTRSEVLELIDNGAVGSAADWPEPRVLYLAHPTDGVGVWSFATLWRSPEWVDRPLGIGVAAHTRWFPIVSWVHETADLAAGFSAVPGFGHDYRDQFVTAWSAIVPPDGWTSADSERLEAHLGL